MFRSIRGRFCILGQAAALATAFCIAPAANATIIIDSFSTQQQVGTGSSGLTSIPSLFTNGKSGLSALGGSRILELYATAGEVSTFDPDEQETVPGDSFRMRVSSSSGTIRYSTDPSVKGKALIVYNGTVSPFLGVTAGQFNAPAQFHLGLGGPSATALDFTQGGNNAFRLAGYADNNGLPVVFTVWRDANNYARGTLNLPGTNVATLNVYQVLFSSFTTHGSQSLTNILKDVRAITVELNGTAPGVTSGTDVVIDYLVATSVPEPATSVLMSGALFGIGLLRRRAL